MEGASTSLIRDRKAERTVASPKAKSGVRPIFAAIAALFCLGIGIAVGPVVMKTDPVDVVALPSPPPPPPSPDVAIAPIEPVRRPPPSAPPSPPPVTTTTPAKPLGADTRANLKYLQTECVPKGVPCAKNMLEWSKRKIGDAERAELIDAVADCVKTCKLR
jgi:hypothetical protein